MCPQHIQWYLAVHLYRKNIIKRNAILVGRKSLWERQRHSRYAIEVEEREVFDPFLGIDTRVSISLSMVPRHHLWLASKRPLILATKPSSTHEPKAINQYYIKPLQRVAMQPDGESVRMCVYARCACCTHLRSCTWSGCFWTGCQLCDKLWCGLRSMSVCTVYVRMPCLVGQIHLA